MDRKRLFLSLTVVYLTICLYYRQALSLLPAILLPIAAHELSHVLALRLLGQRITGLRMEAQGLCIGYSGTCTPFGHILAALAGPVGGTVYALLSFSRISWLKESARLSLLLTAFNLLPILPLDGGRVFSQLCILCLGEARGTAFFRLVSGALLALLLLGGVALALWEKSTSLLAAAIWLLLFQNEEEALVKSGKII